MDSRREGCPVDEVRRATQCSICCEEMPLPPCVTSWLRVRTGAAGVTVLRTGWSQPKAA